MSSFSETRFEKLLTDAKGRLHPDKMKMMLRYHANQLGRLYPKGQRLDSSNFDPYLAWSVGLQMTALNFQTSDRPIQLNRGRFRANGGCGYVLQPAFLRKSGYNPSDENTLIQVRPHFLRYFAVRLVRGTNGAALKLMNRQGWSCVHHGSQ